MRRRRRVGWGIFLLIGGCLFACGPTLSQRGHRGEPLSESAQTFSHRVRRGETLSEIGYRYGVPYLHIARLNNLRDPDRIYVGQVLRIPAGRPGRFTTPSLRSMALVRPRRERAVGRLPFERGTPRFNWPVQGRLTSPFGPRNKSFHDGIDLAAPIGTPILAAAAGEVIFSGVLRGYGKVVIIRHRNGYATVYAHNRVNLVKEGQIVRRGQRVAKLGRTGRVTGPHLHFEIRRSNLARNPLPYLPRTRWTARTSR